MEEEKRDQTGLQKQSEGSAMKFTFTASKPKFSSSRPPLFPKGKQRGEGREEQRGVEFVTGFDEQGIVAKDPKGLRGARVIPKLENSWRPEKRMKNIMIETDIMTDSEERFEKETILGGLNPDVKYGLTVGVKKVESIEQTISVIVTEENGSVLDEGMEEKDENIAPVTVAQLEDERLRQDLVTLPDEADLDAYDDMPVEDFGEAILRGMGWEKGKPIGRNSKVAVVPVEYVRRSGRTGLGAEPAPKEANNQRQIKPGQSRAPAPDLVASVAPDGRVRHVVTVDEKLIERDRKGVVNGKVMSIISGRHLGLRAEVLDSEKLDRVSVKLVKSGAKVVVNSKDLADIGSFEEEKVLKQIRQLKIDTGEASRRDDRRGDVDNVDADDTRSARKDQRDYARGDDRRENRNEKDSRRNERAEYRMEVEERGSRSRRDSRKDERGYRDDQKALSGREGRKERKREEYERTVETEADYKERSRRTEERKGSGREQKRDDKRDDGGSRERRRADRREDEMAEKETWSNLQQRGDGRGKHNDVRILEERSERQKPAANGGSADMDAVGPNDARRYSDGWLASQIRVRIVSKTLKGGKLYLKKGRIVDLVTPKECDVLLDDSGEILQHVKQDYLETALPKRGGRIMVVGGRHRGMLGKLIERDSEGETGLVQMEESFEMVTLDLDLLAEFVGDASERDN